MEFFVREKYNHLAHHILHDEQYEMVEENQSKDPHVKSIIPSKNIMDASIDISIPCQESEIQTIESFWNYESKNGKGKQEIISFAEGDEIFIRAACYIGILFFQSLPNFVPFSLFFSFDCLQR